MPAPIEPAKPQEAPKRPEPQRSPEPIQLRFKQARKKVVGFTGGIKQAFEKLVGTAKGVDLSQEQQEIATLSKDLASLDDLTAKALEAPQVFEDKETSPKEEATTETFSKKAEETVLPERDLAQHTYVGLERLDEIAKDEPLVEGFAEHGTGPTKERAQAKLDAMRREREEILEKYGIDKELCEENGINFELLKDGKGVSKLLIKREAAELPSIKEGNIRMFRGEGPHPGKTEDWTIGRWFAHDLSIASSYPLGPLAESRIMYVDIPRTDLAKYHVRDMPEFRGASKGGEYLIPQDVVAQAKEFIRFLKADTTGDPWTTS